MNMRIILICFFLFSSILMIQADNTTFADSYQANYKFSYVKDGNPDEQRSNYVLQQISYDNSIPFSDLHLELAYVLNINVRALSNRQSELTLMIGAGNIFGNTRIKQMDVSGQLQASICTFEYRLYNKQTGALYKQELVSQPLNERVLKIKHLIPERLKKDELGLEFYDLKFYYSEKDVVRLKSFVSLIENYYASASLADSMLIKASKWRPDIERDLLSNYFKINNFKRIYSIIKNKEFENIFNLKQNDPANLLGDLDALSLLNRRLQSMLTEGAKGQKLYFPKELLLAEQIVDYQLEYEGFLKESDLDNATFMDELSQINYSKAWYSDIHNIFVKGLSKRNQSLVEAYFERLVNALRNTHQAKAAQLIEEKRYSQALIQIKNAKKLHSLFNDTDLKSLNELKAKAVFGLYQSYLDVANRALSMSNKDLSRLYLNKALNIQQQNLDVLSRDNDGSNSYRQFIRELITKAKNLKVAAKYPQATSKLIEAINMSEQVVLVDFDQDIETELYDIYKLESYRILKLNDHRLFLAKKDNEEAEQKEILRLKENQKIILNQLQRLKH